MDKVYRIKATDDLYVKCVVVDGNGEENWLSAVFTFDISESALYEEDKAKGYCEELKNNNRLYKDLGVNFKLEEVERK